jgi:hypothetical protein
VELAITAAPLFPKASIFWKKQAAWEKIYRDLLAQAVGPILYTFTLVVQNAK